MRKTVVVALVATLSMPTAAAAAKWSLLCGYDQECIRNLSNLGNALSGAGSALERHDRPTETEYEISRCRRFGTQTTCTIQPR